MKNTPLLACLALFLAADLCRAMDGLEFQRWAESIRISRESARARDGAALRKLAGEFLERGLGGPLAKVLDILDKVDPGNAETESLRAKASGLKGGTPIDLQWARVKTKAAATEALKIWNTLLDTCAREGFRTTGLSVAGICLAYDPDHAKARAFLGHVKKGETWIDAETAKYAAAGKAFLPAWGYVSKEEEKKLESGLRLLKGKWIPRTREEAAARSWAEPLELEAGRLRVSSTLPYDLTKDVLLRLRTELDRFENFFGDLFPPCTTTCTVLLARTEEDFLELLRKHEYPADLGQYESFFQPGSNLLFVNASKFGLTASGVGALESSDPIARDLCIWVLMQGASTGGCVEAGYWSFLGTRLLAECCNLDAPRRNKSWRLNEWRVRRENDPFPTFAKLPSWDMKDCTANPEVGMYVLGLCHYFLHGDGGARRIPFLACLRNYVLGYPQGEAEKTLGLSDPGLEAAVDAHMKALLGR